MTRERYPADLVVTKDDFERSGWKDAVQSNEARGYTSMWTALSLAAGNAIDEGELHRGKVLWLLADACSIMLRPESPNQPFRSVMEFENKRTALPADLSVQDLRFFSDIVDGIDDPWLQARLADLVWLTSQPREVRFAHLAIDAYRTIPLDADNWPRDNSKCWERAARLALTLGKGAAEARSDIEQSIVSRLRSTSAHDGYYGLRLSRILHETGLAREEASFVAAQLELVGQQLEDEGNISRARDYFDSAAQWFQLNGNESKMIELTIAVAEAWVKEAEVRLAGDNPSHMVAASFYENAIQKYRTVPNRHRDEHGVTERINQLRDLLDDSGARSLDEMGVMETPGIDLAGLVEASQAAVSGKSLREALEVFANLHSASDVEQLRQSALDNIKASPLASIVPATFISRDGRVIAKHSGMQPGDPSSADDDTIMLQMIRNYRITVGIAVQGKIIPALHTLLREHRVDESDFISLARLSPIVPHNRGCLFGKAIFAGFERDFVTAIHILAPQIEHMVRFHLKVAGEKTTTLDSNGIENESGLSTLIESPKVAHIFGERLAFELKALYCDPLGPNLRNEIAHGLLGDSECTSAEAVYAWWLAVKIVCNAFWNAARKQEGGSGT